VRFKLANILEQINKLKVSLKSLSESTGDLPDEIKPQVDMNFKTIRELLNTTGVIVEKHFKDQKTADVMSKELLDKMDTLEIYKGFSTEKKEDIVEKIVDDKDLVLLDIEGLHKFVEDKLKTEDDEALIRKAYNKKDILKLGEAVTKSNASEVMKYDAGMKVLTDMVKTPTGRKDAIAYGIRRLMGNTTTVQYYLLLYYGM
jgi:hypothetical protein